VTTTTTTTALRLAWRDRARTWLAQRDPFGIIALVLIAPIVGMLIAAALVRLPPSPAVRTPDPILIIATARAAPLPTANIAKAMPVPTAPPRLVTAYDQPEGSAFPDPIAQPDPATWIGRWGDGWIEVAWQPNPVWIRAEDIGAELADVRPVPAVVIAEPPPPPAPVPTPAHLYGLTDADMDRALADHNAQQLAWCADKQSAYCDLVRAASQR
jgi:hypothetical protein